MAFKSCVAQATGAGAQPHFILAVLLLSRVASVGGVLLPRSHHQLVAERSRNTTAHVLPLGDWSASAGRLRARPLGFSR